MHAGSGQPGNDRFLPVRAPTRNPISAGCAFSTQGGGWERSRRVGSSRPCLRIRTGPIEACGRSRTILQRAAICLPIFGETLVSAGEDGWMVVTVDGFSLGWGSF